MRLSLFSLTLFAGSLVSAVPFLQERGVYPTDTNAQVTIHSAKDFCMFLPPKQGIEVAPYEDNGKPFCTKKNETPGAKAFPKGFITVAHYNKTAKYEQVTGYMDRTKYNLLESDGGGQYDNHANGKPIGATCVGYKYFVSMIEPSDNRFCIRCCHSKVDCNSGRSEYGCLRVVPGDYSRSSKTVSALGHSDDTDWQIPPASGSFNAIASVIKVIQTELDDGTPLGEIQSHWTNFLSSLSDQYPDSAGYISRLQDITGGFSTREDWEELVKVFGGNDIGEHQDQASW